MYCLHAGVDLKIDFQAPILILKAVNGQSHDKCKSGGVSVTINRNALVQQPTIVPSCIGVSLADHHSVNETECTKVGDGVYYIGAINTNNSVVQETIVPSNSNVSLTSGHLGGKVKDTDVGDGVNELCPIYDSNWGVTDDKFLHSIMNKKKCVAAPNNCVSFQNWRSQSKVDFGFVPLTDFVLPENTEIRDTSIKDPFCMHEKVKASGRPNFLGCRIPVESQLNIPAWQEALQVLGYPAYRVISLWFSP